MSATIYIEGGGDGESLKVRIREAWTKYFTAAGLAGRMPRVVRGGGRKQTFDLFETAVRNPRPGKIPMLLVDSEEPSRMATACGGTWKIATIGKGRWVLTRTKPFSWFR